MKTQALLHCLSLTTSWNTWWHQASKFLRRKVKVELNLSNYVTKADLKNATGADTSKFAETVDFANLKSKVDK